MAEMDTIDACSNPSPLKIPVTEIVDLLTDDDGSPDSPDATGVDTFELGDEDEWSMFEDALAQASETDDRIDISDGKRLSSAKGRLGLTWSPR